MAYGLHKKPDINHILVFDFGGGTPDAVSYRARSCSKLHRESPCVGRRTSGRVPDRQPPRNAGRRLDVSILYVQKGSIEVAAARYRFSVLCSPGSSSSR